jgi:hypothetical protein
VQAGDDGLGELLDVLAALVRSNGSGVGRAGLVGSEGVGTGLFALIDLNNLDLVLLFLDTANEALGADDSALSSAGPDVLGELEVLVAVAHLYTEMASLETTGPGQQGLLLDLGRLPGVQEVELGDLAPVNGGVGELLGERLQVGLVVERVGVDGSVADQVCGLGHGASLRRQRVSGRVVGLVVRCNACEVLQRVEGVVRVERALLPGVGSRQEGEVRQHIDGCL